MPYRLNPNNKKQVQVKRRGRWIVLKTHPTVRKARAHLYMLNKNVTHRAK